MSQESRARKQDTGFLFRTDVFVMMDYIEGIRQRHNREGNSYERNDFKSILGVIKSTFVS